MNPGYGSSASFGFAVEEEEEEGWGCGFGAGADEMEGAAENEREGCFGEEVDGAGPEEEEEATEPGIVFWRGYVRRFSLRRRHTPGDPFEQLTDAEKVCRRCRWCLFLFPLGCSCDGRWQQHVPSWCLVRAREQDVEPRRSFGCLGRCSRSGRWRAVAVLGFREHGRESGQRRRRRVSSLRFEPLGGLCGGCC